MSGLKPEPARDRPYLAGLVISGLLVMVVFLSVEWRLTGELSGVPLDDSWIHYRFAENLREGQGFSFNPGEPTPGSTAPLWVMALSLLGGGFLVPSKVVGILAYLACGLLVYRLCVYGTGSRAVAFLAGLGALFAGRMAWAAPSGMETTAFTALSLLALLAWGKSCAGSISPWASLAFGLACLLRPEGYLLLGLSGLDYLIRANRSSWESFISCMKPLVKHLLIAGLVVSPYLFFSLLTTGRLLPNTFYAKSAVWGCRPGAGYFAWIGTVFLLDSPVMAILAAGGVAAVARYRSWREQRALTLGAAWLVALPLFYGVLAPCISGYYTRYTTPLVPVMMVFAGVGAVQARGYLHTWLTRVDFLKWRPESATRLFMLLMAEGVFLGLAPAFLFWAGYYGRSVADIAEMHLQTGRWLAENSRPGEVLALNDIGAIGSTADREVIDLMGLISPEVLGLISGKGPGEWDGALAGYLASRHPDFLVIFPNWFPGLAAQLPARPVYRVQLPPRQIAGLPGITPAGGGELVVYRLDWDGDQ